MWEPQWRYQKRYLMDRTPTSTLLLSIFIYSSVFLTFWGEPADQTIAKWGYNLYPNVRLNVKVIVIFLLFLCYQEQFSGKISRYHNVATCRCIWYKNIKIKYHPYIRNKNILRSETRKERVRCRYVRVICRFSCAK